jgi:hypothetical protein
MKSYSIKGQTALITGASSGIGKACAEYFAAAGVNLVLTARRLDRLEKIAEDLSKQHGIRCIANELDVRDQKQVEALFSELSKTIPAIDILVNNAGLALTSDKAQDAQTENWDIMIDTNVKGLLYVTKAALSGMIKQNRGHIINIGSTAAHGCYASGNVYCATKHAVRALSKSLRIDLMGTALRVSEVDPGAVETEFSVIRWKDEDKAKKFYQGFDPLVAHDVADAVLYCATRAPHVNVAELVVCPQAQGDIAQIYRAGEPIKSMFDAAKK